MTLQELKEQNPELVQQIEDESMKAVQDAADVEKETAIRDAVEKELTRLKNIESIAASIGDPKLVEKAKYGEGKMTAQELAFEAMKESAKAGEKFLNDVGDDFKNSGADGIKPLPNSGNKNQKDEAMEDVANGAALIAGITKK